MEFQASLMEGGYLKGINTERRSMKGLGGVGGFHCNLKK